MSTPLSYHNKTEAKPHIQFLLRVNKIFKKKTSAFKFKAVTPLFIKDNVVEFKKDNA